MADTALHIPSLKDKVSPEEWAVRVDLAACYRLVVRYGWEDLVFTHITARVPGTQDQFLINPYGVFFDEMIYEDTEAGVKHQTALNRYAHDAGCWLPLFKMQLKSIYAVK